MAITIDRDIFKLDRIIDDIILLPFTDADILIDANRQITADNININFNKLYANLKYMYAYSYMYKPVMVKSNGINYNDNTNVQTFDLVNSTDITAVKLIKSSTLGNTIYAFVGYKTKIEVYNVILDGNNIPVSKTLILTINNIYDSAFNVKSFSGIYDMTNDSNILYVLDSDNIYKIDIAEIINNNIAKVYLLELTQGFKDTLFDKIYEVTAQLKLNLYNNIKIAANANYVVVLDNTFTDVMVLKVMDKNLNLISITAYKEETYKYVDLDIKDNIVHIIGQSTNSNNVPKKYKISVDKLITTAQFDAYKYFKGDIAYSIIPIVFDEIKLLNENMVYTGFDFSDNTDGLMYIIGSGNNTPFRLYRTFISKCNRVIDSRETDMLNVNCLDTIYYKTSDEIQNEIVGVSCPTAVKLFYINTPIINAFNDTTFKIYDLNSSGISDEEIIQPFVFNKALYKVFHDNLVFINAIQGQFTGLIVSNLKRNGAPEIVYNGIKYPSDDILLNPYYIENPDNFISINEILSHNTFNRCISNILDLQKYMIKIIQSNMGDIALAGIGIS